MKEKRTCKYCGDDISGRHKNARYCQKRECHLKRKKWEYRLRKKVEVRECELCGEEFYPVNARHKYCPGGCQELVRPGGASKPATHKQPGRSSVFVPRADDWNHKKYMEEQKAIRNNGRVCLKAGCELPTGGIHFHCEKHRREINAIANHTLDWDGDDAQRRSFGGVM